MGGEEDANTHNDNAYSGHDIDGYSFKRIKSASDERRLNLPFEHWALLHGHHSSLPGTTRLDVDARLTDDARQFTDYG